MNEENTVSVATLPDFLSDAEKEILSEHLTLPQLQTEEIMIENLTIAKTFVHAVVTD